MANATEMDIVRGVQKKKMLPKGKVGKNYFNLSINKCLLRECCVVAEDMKKQQRELRAAMAFRKKGAGRGCFKGRVRVSRERIRRPSYSTVATSWACFFDHYVLS